MEILIITLLFVVLSQTSYLAYRQLSHEGIAKGAILLDTSVLIDGRIVEIVRSGLVSERLIVPRSVVRELQFMADRADHDKRERARFGLDIIEKLQEIVGTQVEVKEDGITSQHGVDEQLINLAKSYKAKLCTVDYNLNKAARVQAVEVVNINELAHALRVVHLPGETVSVPLVQPGQDKKQAVGYLDDGTMVVVDDARDFMGKTIEVQLTRVLQTTAGRMMFAKRTSATSGTPRTDKVRTSKPAEKNTPSRRKPNQRRRSTPEDALVELANEKR